MCPSITYVIDKISDGLIFYSQLGWGLSNLSWLIRKPWFESKYNWIFVKHFLINMALLASVIIHIIHFCDMQAQIHNIEKVTWRPTIKDIIFVIKNFFIWATFATKILLGDTTTNMVGFICSLIAQTSYCYWTFCQLWWCKQW